MTKPVGLVSSAIVLLFSSVAFAGDWAEGRALLVTDTPEALIAAVESAAKMSLENAKAAIKSRGEGCIGVGKDGSGPSSRVTKKPKEGDDKTQVITFYTFYSLDAGSCGQDSSDEMWLRENVDKALASFAS